MYISFETAKLAKQAGYDEPAWSCYNAKGKPFDYSRNIYAYENGGKHFSRPTQEELHAWLREVHSMFIDISTLTTPNEILGFNVTIKSWKFTPIEVESDITWNLALENGLVESLKRILTVK